METKAIELAQKQLDAYNNQDINKFLEVYADDVTIMEFPTNNIMYKGKAKMLERYSALFHNNPKQHAELLSRMAKGNIVIDHEYVTGRENGKDVYAIAIYEIKNDVIKNVWFAK